MRLLRLDSHKNTWILEDFSPPHCPFYVILSHTWSRDNDEVRFEDIESGEREYNDTSKPGYDKLRFCQTRVERDGLRYFWIDTCCIKKSDSYELQRSLASMFYWYQRATRCYVWLQDVSISDATDDTGNQWEKAFSKSMWFKRGWTLQEPLAPDFVSFFSKEKIYVGEKRSLASTISNVCAIPRPALEGVELSHFSPEERLSWTKGRVTTVPEDAAYCLFGIFDVELPTLYADGNYTKRKNIAMGKLHKAIDEKDVDFKHPDDCIHIGGAFWKDLIILREEQLLALDSDLDEFCKWLLEGFLSQYADEHHMLRETMTRLSQDAGKRMKKLLANYNVRYEDLSHLENDMQSWESWVRYRTGHATSQTRVQALVTNRWRKNQEHENTFEGITAARTLEMLMIWRGTWNPV
ncbi:heterokaryon incompatibility protein-domain-containing protein [Alternaria rosae]|uniref:heterokaryon incompatibility protein-domain-containing protein n=1 Tax=Alternaria rosae TaxID=1187941 RepID=UPI001E8D8645|nr:heterokaryon incompatibility protein-domain-containing protein [Alternaria rosae]KAH6881917.1 heterokaryon incompatibility protein-domain-containing protein [Alternaria rosae]